MLEKIEKPEIETVKLEPNGTYGMFVLAPLERGYGTALLASGCCCHLCKD